MPIIGIGVDLVRISRFSSIYARHGTKFFKRFFHPKELENQPKNDALIPQYYASRWAVKEATWKAFGKRINHVFVINDEITRKPNLVLEGEALQFARHLVNTMFEEKNLKTHVSISHEDNEYVSAFVVLEAVK